MADHTTLALSWYRWFPNVFRQKSRKVRMMTFDQRACYRELLDECWNDGSIPDDPEVLARLVGFDPAKFSTEVWPVIRQCFHQLEDGQLANEFMDRERAQAVARLRNASDAAKKRWLQPRPKSTLNASALLEHCEGNAKRREDKRGEVSTTSESPKLPVNESENKPPIRSPGRAGRDEVAERSRMEALEARLRSLEAFENQFWPICPRKREKPDALKAWRRANPDGALDEVIPDALLEVIDLDWRFREIDRVPYPASWLNAGGHTDEVEDADQGQPFGRWYVRAQERRFAERLKAVVGPPTGETYAAIWAAKERFVADVKERKAKVEAKKNGGRRR